MSFCQACATALARSQTSRQLRMARPCVVRPQASRQLQMARPCVKFDFWVGEAYPNGPKAALGDA